MILTWLRLTLIPSVPAVKPLNCALYTNTTAIDTIYQT